MRQNKFELLARAGYAARGIVYLLLGGIALSGGVASTGEEASSQGALSSLLEQPFGRLALGAIAVGLLGHVLWRLAQSVLNADHREHSMKGYLPRAGHFAAAMTNALLALFAAQLALGMGGAGGSGGGEERAAASLMEQPFGRWLVAGVALALIVAGLAQVFYGLKAKFLRRLALPQRHERWLKPVSAFGIAARGVLFIVVGGLFGVAALTLDPSRAGSTTEALDWVHGLPFGNLLYLLAALGLIAFGGYSFVQARYRRVDAPDPARIAQSLPVG